MQSLGTGSDKGCWFNETEAPDSMVKGVVGMRTPIDRLAILLMIVGAINWLT
ncbi:MAG: DUF378 domain-containing protein, partial [Clostridiaceae bacterium]|nr:DUF378 domain-containing protein [Clostridiaceae bacterium]